MAEPMRALILYVVNQSVANVTLIVISIKNLNLVGKIFFSCHPIRNGPKILCEYNHLCMRSLDLAKQKAAPTAGVLQGIPGRIKPAYATANKIIPRLNHSIFFKFFFFPTIRTFSVRFHIIHFKYMTITVETKDAFYPSFKEPIITFYSTAICRCH